MRPTRARREASPSVCYLRSGRAPWATILVASIAALALLALGTTIVGGRVRRERALDRIRARGEPLLPTDIAFAPPGEGVEPSEWLARLASLPYAEADIEAIEPCQQELDAAGDALALVLDLQARRYDPARIDGLGPCERSVLRQHLDLNAELLATALEVDRFARVDVRARMGQGSEAMQMAARLPFSEVWLAARLLCAAALDAAAEGDAPRALDRIERASMAADLLGGESSVLAHEAWIARQSEVVRASARIATMLPAGTDFSVIERRLEALDPAASQRLAYLGECAFANAFYAELRSESALLSSTSRIWLAHDQADYLAEMERAIDACGLRPPRPPQPEWERRFYSSASAMLIFRWWDHVERTARLEAQILVARGVILARRAGAGAALAWAAAQRDPFREEPLRARLDGEGVFWIWSIGEDGVDDEGSLRSPAIEGEGQPPAPDVIARTIAAPD